jgi:leucyl aminopeptidase
MKISSTDADVARIEADAVVIGVSADSSVEGPAAEFDQASGGVLTRLLASKEITGKRYELTSILAPAGLRTGHLLAVGLGEVKSLDRGAAFRASAAAARRLADKERGRVAFYLGPAWPAQWIEAGVCGAMAGCHGQDLYRAEKKRHPFAELIWPGADQAVLRSGQILGESVNLARRLVNEPPSKIYPETFADAAAQVAGQCGLDIEIWDRDRLEAERCGALLAVSRGSARPPRMVILSRLGAGPDQPILALAGKGVTFDSGGLSLKPADSMKTMKCDMAGAAAVLAALQAVSRLALPVNVIGLIGLVENMVGGESYKIGDVLTARSGKTIEVLNTDAEGRLVLADVLSVAVDRKAAKIIDLATLTGACMVALGLETAGLMTNNQNWCDFVAKTASDCGEPAWQLPMFDSYGEEIEGAVADIKNIGEGRWGGAITAAKFLEEFVAGKPWTHIDIAGPSFLEKDKPWLDAGGSGAFVRTLVEVARRWNETSGEDGGQK